VKVGDRVTVKCGKSSCDGIVIAPQFIPIDGGESVSILLDNTNFGFPIHNGLGVQAPYPDLRRFTIQWIDGDRWGLLSRETKGYHGWPVHNFQAFGGLVMFSKDELSRELSKRGFDVDLEAE
jgi:hypothetical protein